jgi:hypothetical protein
MKLTKIKLKQLIKEVKQEQTLKENQFADTAEEEAEKVNDQTGLSLITDPEHWAQAGVHTGEDLAKTLLASSYSDLYKSINGIRPRHMNFKGMSVEELQAALDQLDEYAEELPEEDEIQYPRDDETLEDEETDLAPPEEPYEEYDEFPKQAGMRHRIREYNHTKQLVLDALKSIIK